MRSDEPPELEGVRGARRADLPQVRAIGSPTRWNSSLLRGSQQSFVRGQTFGPLLPERIYIHYGQAFAGCDSKPRGAASAEHPDRL